MKRDNKPILEFVAIKRRDCGEWAIPGVSCQVNIIIARLIVLCDWPGNNGM